MPDERINIVEGNQHEMEIKLTEIKGDVAHIKDRIDNGMSITITSMNDTLTKIMTEFVPQVKDNSFWVGKIKWGVFWIATITVGGGLSGVLMRWLAH